MIGHGDSPHLETLARENRRHLDATRQLRRDIWQDGRQDRTFAAIMGITGSSEELRRHYELTRSLGKLGGQPLIRIQEVARDGRVKRATGGIIAGRVYLDNADFAPGQPPGRGSANARFAVPLRRVFQGYNPTSTGEFEVEAATDVESVTVSHLVLDELRNVTYDPSGDYRNLVLPDRLAAGRKAIYESPFFHAGLSEMMLTMEAAALSAVPADTVPQ